MGMCVPGENALVCEDYDRRCSRSNPCEPAIIKQRIAFGWRAVTDNGFLVRLGGDQEFEKFAFRLLDLFAKSKDSAPGSKTAFSSRPEVRARAPYRLG